MDISEETLDTETMDSILGCADEACELLHVDSVADDPSEIVSKIDQHVFVLQKGNGPIVSEDDDPALLLGSLWAQQMVRQFGWQWAGVTFHDHEDSKAVGVFSPDRSLAIYPFHFIWGCLENEAPVTIELSFNILKDASRVPSLPAKGYENVMDNVHHIVPRE